MKTLRSLEGELTIDHRNSPGVPVEILIASGLPVEAGRGMYESATYTCNHCQSVVVMNPQRTRERHVCKGCAHVICDGCAEEKARTLQCVTFEQKVDLVLAGK